MKTYFYIDELIIQKQLIKVPVYLRFPNPQA